MQNLGKNIKFFDLVTAVYLNRRKGSTLTSSKNQKRKVPLNLKSTVFTAGKFRLGHFLQENEKVTHLYSTCTVHCQYVSGNKLVQGHQYLALQSRLNQIFNM